MVDREILETYSNSASKNTPETDIFPHGLKSFSTSVICMDRGSCLSRNDSLIIQISSGRLLLNGGMYQAFVHIDQWNGV